MMTGRQIAEQLDIDKTAIPALQKFGLLDEPQRIGRALAYSNAAELVQREFINDRPHPRILAVKVVPREDTPADPYREYRGWDPTKTADDPEQIKAVAGYWKVKDPQTLIGDLFIPIGKTFTLAVYRIVGYRQHGNDLIFELEIPDRDTIEKWSHTRVRSQPGSLIERLPVSD